MKKKRNTYRYALGFFGTPGTIKHTVAAESPEQADCQIDNLFFNLNRGFYIVSRRDP